MPTVIPDTVVRKEVLSTTGDNDNIILIPEGVKDICYSAKVAASGTGNAVQATVDSFTAIQANTAVYFDVVPNVTATAFALPTALADGSGNPITVTALRAHFGDQNITLVLLANRAV